MTGQSLHPWPWNLKPDNPAMIMPLYSYCYYKPHPIGITYNIASYAIFLWPLNCCLEFEFLNTFRSFCLWQLLHGGHSHGWQLTVTQPWAPMLGAHDWGGSVAGTCHSDEISENGMEGGRLMTKPKHNNANASNWFLKLLKVLHILRTLKTHRILVHGT